jgi:hypothetical protein
MSQQGKVVLQVLSTLSRALDLSTVKDALATEYAYPFGDGSDPNQADALWHDRRTLAAGAGEALDLAGGTLEDAFGAALALAGVKALVVHAAVDNGADLHVAIPVAAGVGSPTVTVQTIALPPGGLLALVAPGVAGSPLVPGFAVAAGTWDTVTVENQDVVAEAVYEVIVLGVAA